MTACPIEVLLVEDSPSDAELIVEALRDAKVRNTLSVVEDGVQAMQFLRRQGPYANAPPPDLILLDLNLEDGREVLAEIKADEKLASIPVVVQAMQALSRQAMALLELRRVSSRTAEALERIKTLHVLLPICAWCKRIRDDQGYWSQVEAHVHAKTGVDFTHGICPDCFAKQRPKRQPEA